MALTWIALSRAKKAFDTVRASLVSQWYSANQINLMETGFLNNGQAGFDSVKNGMRPAVTSPKPGSVVTNPAPAPASTPAPTTPSAPTSTSTPTTSSTGSNKYTYQNTMPKTLIDYYSKSGYSQDELQRVANERLKSPSAEGDKIAIANWDRASNYTEPSAPTAPASTATAPKPTVPATTPVNETARQAEFEEWFGAYIKENEKIYNTETSRQNQQFDWKTTDNASKLARDQADYAKFTGREIQDTARQLAMNDTNFSKAMSSATQAYGKRGILNAGIQKSGITDNVANFGKDQTYLQTLSQRRLQDAGDTMARGTQDATTTADRLGVQRAQYAGDRASGLQVQNTQLQQQGDSLYNQSSIQRVQLAQQQADLAAIDAFYGRTPQNRPTTMRLMGNYIN